MAIDFIKASILSGTNGNNLAGLAAYLYRQNWHNALSGENYHPAYKSTDLAELSEAAPAVPQTDQNSNSNFDIERKRTSASISLLGKVLPKGEGTERWRSALSM